MSPDLKLPVELSKQAKAHWQVMSTAHRKSAFALRASARQFINTHGVDHVAFVCFTIPGKAPTIREATSKFNSLATNCLNTNKRTDTPLVGPWIRVTERGDKNDRVHFHMLIATKDDIRTGTDFEAFKKGDYRSANPELRKLWKFFRDNATNYGFGRVHSVPVKSDSEACSAYLAKYISAHINKRRLDDKGARLLAYSKGVAASSSRFSFQSPGSDVSRKKLMHLATGLGFTAENYPAKFQMHFGKKWMYHLGPIIKTITLPVYETVLHLAKDFPDMDIPDEYKWTCREFSRDDFPRLHRESLRNALHRASLFYNSRLYRRYLREEGEAPKQLRRSQVQEGRGVAPPEELFTIEGPVWPD